MYLCLCYPITETQIKKLATEIESFEEFKTLIQAGEGCGTCKIDEQVLRKYFELGRRTLQSEPLSTQQGDQNDQEERLKSN